jgi:hypothetical protein
VVIERHGSRQDHRNRVTALRSRGSENDGESGSPRRAARSRQWKATAGALVACAVTALSVASAPSRTARGAGFDFDTGNAVLEVVVPHAFSGLSSAEAPAPSDASIVLRFTTIANGSMFDAIAPYHPTAVGVYAKLGRRPAAERTQHNKNIAILYAAYRAFRSSLPGSEAVWRDMLTSVGLNPDDNQENGITPIGIGNSAGNAWVAAHLHDGMNQLGDEGGRKYNRQRYADYTGYRPVNTAYQLRDPSRWQPLVVTSGNGVFRVQQFVTPQEALLAPFSYPRAMMKQLRVPPPTQSNPVKDPAGYKAQADEVLAASAGLTDEQKATAELFNNKFTSLGFSQFFISAARGHSLDQFVQLAFLTNLASYDTAIPVWSEKRRYDTVRPTSAIRHLYGDTKLRAWGGPGRGTVTDITGNEWRSYLPTADHPEYPSGSANLCAAHAEAMRRFIGDDRLGWAVPVAKGSSEIEPGITPATDIVLHFDTWSQFERTCAMSRLWGGVHFRAAIEAAIDNRGTLIGHRVADLAYEFVKAHIDGAA